MKAYSVAQAAAELGISANLVYGLCRQRKIRHERHGLGRGKIMIRSDALEEYRRAVTVGVAGKVTRAAPPPARPKLSHLGPS